MEDKTKDRLVETIDQTRPTGVEGAENAYVSPDVLAAQNGEAVEMGKQIVDPEPNTTEE